MNKIFNNYTCEYCNKKYSSRQSRWNHIKQYHNTDNTPILHQNDVNVPPLIHQNIKTSKQLKCTGCNKLFSRSDALNRHNNLNRCKKILATELKDEKDEYKKLFLDSQKQIIEYQKQIDELKTLIQKSIKIHPKTLQKINNQLNDCTINNNTFNIIQLGKENLDEIMSDKEKLAILNNNANCINELIKKVHISKDDKYRKFIGLVRKK